MSSTKQQKQHMVDAAVKIAEDIAKDKLDPSAIEAEVVAKCRELFGVVYGPEDALWELHIDVIRQGLAMNALSANELAEWQAVIRLRENEQQTAQGESWIERVLAEGATDDDE